MSRKRKVFLLLLPPVLWVLAMLAYLYQTSQLEAGLHPIDGLTYGSGGNLLRIGFSRSIENELSTNVITVRDVNDEIVFRNTIQLDHDLYGRSIVKAMQMDSDPELEILAWGDNVRVGESFILDYVNGQVRMRDYDKAPEQVKRFVQQYRNSGNEAGVFIGLLVLTTPLYYLILFLVWLIGRLSGKSRNQQQAESTDKAL